MELDIKLLTNIQKTLAVDPAASQRSLAQNLHVSLGMMNAVLNRFIERGWVAVKNLNMKKVHYVLTSEGMEIISERSAQYVKRTFGLINEYSDSINRVIMDAKKSGKNVVILYGKSCIKFLIEYACSNAGMYFEECSAQGVKVLDKNALCLAGELAGKDIQKKLREAGAVSIFDVVGNC